MLLLISALVLSILFFYIHRGEYIERQVYFAIGFMAFYLTIYFFLPTEYVGTGVHMGRLYELVPFVSLGAILFPELNNQAPAKVTQTFGWMGLVTTAIVLLVFKLFIWS